MPWLTRMPTARKTGNYPDILLQGNIDNTDIKAVTKDGKEVGRTFTLTSSMRHR